MPLRKKVLDAPSGSQYEQDWSFNIPTGGVLHEIHVWTNLKNYKTMAKAELKIHDTVIGLWRGQLSDLLDKAYSRKQYGGLFKFRLADFDLRDPQGIGITSIATSDKPFFDDKGYMVAPADVVTLTLGIGARDTSDADAANHDPATISMRGTLWYEPNPMRNMPLGGRKIIPRIWEMTPRCNAAGEHKQTVNIASPNLMLQRVFVREDNVQISRVQTKLGNDEISDSLRHEIDFELGYFSRDRIKPVPGYLTLDYTQTGFGRAEALNTDMLNWTLHCNQEGTMQMICMGYERVGV